MENYEQKYKEALSRAQSALKDGTITTNSIAYLQDIFPELKESEDEKIRKAITEFFELQDDNTTFSFVSKKDILAWLEKQGEQKPKGESAFEAANEEKADNANKVEHKPTDSGREADCTTKSAWSEEDEAFLNDVINYFNVDDALQHQEKEVISWLKSLKERLGN